MRNTDIDNVRRALHQVQTKTVYYATSTRGCEMATRCISFSSRRSRVLKNARVVILHLFARVAYAIFCNVCEKLVFMH